MTFRQGLMLLSGALCLLVLAERNGYRLGQPFVIDAISAHGQMFLLLLGAVLLLSSSITGNWHHLPTLLRRERRDILIVLGIMAVGLALRLWELESDVPVPLDESPFMVAVTRLRDQPFSPVLKPMAKIASFTHVYAYAQWWMTELAGGGLFALRSVSAIAGTLTLASTYLLTRALFRRRNLALGAALLLATFPPHLHFSRLGLNNIADPLFGTLALTCLVYALRSKHRGWYVAAGVATGLLPYFYEGGELVFPALMLGWLLGLLIWGREKATWRGIGWLILTAGLMAIPVYYTLVAVGLPLFTRLEDRSIPDDFWMMVLFNQNGLEWLVSFIQSQILPPFSHYLVTSDTSLFYGGNTALILPPLVPLFVLGLGRVGWLSRRAFALLVVWLVLTAVGNSLIYDPAWSARFVVTFPALVIGLAAGVEAICHFSMSAFQPKRQIFGRLAALLIILLIAGGQFFYYFGGHLPVYRQQLAPLIAYYDVVWRVPNLPPGTQAYLLDDDYIQAYYTLFWYSYRGNDAKLVMIAPDLFDPAALDPTVRYAVFIAPDDRANRAKLEAHFALLPPVISRSPYVTPEHGFVLYWALPH